jgi:exopolyphosphatase/pppGpp-phosphohydrolase
MSWQTRVAEYARKIQGYSLVNTSNIETEIRLRYSAIRSVVPSGMPTAVLHIGAEQTSVATGTGAEPDMVHMFPIGSRKTAVEYFHHDPPTPGEIENAIVAVEDAVASARTMISGGTNLFTTRLFTTDEAIRKIALISGVTDGAELILARDSMERTFERLAAVTLGRSSSQQGIPAGVTFAATLLILREFMHHLQFLSITVKA